MKEQKDVYPITSWPRGPTLFKIENNIDWGKRNVYFNHFVFLNQ